MTANKRSDQIFQLSLTEIAFTLAFILLLLLGYLVLRESDAKKRAESALTKVEELGTAQQVFSEASRRLEEGLKRAGSTDPDEVISKLIAEAKVVTERDRLLVRVKDLELQVSALSEIKHMAADAANPVVKKAMADRVISALAVQSEAEQAIGVARQKEPPPVSQTASLTRSVPTAEVRGEAAAVNRKGFAPQKSLSSEETRAEVRQSIQMKAAVERALRDSGAKPLQAGKEAETVAGMIRAAQTLKGMTVGGKGMEAVLRENADLRGQMANMRNRFNAVGRGLDHPPCWADEAGNIEYLFKIELRQGLVVVSPEWPERRQIDAEKLPGISQLTAGPMNHQRFRAASQPILEISKRQNPECRHFVKIDNTIETRREADQARWMVENFFYKREIGR